MKGLLQTEQNTNAENGTEIHFNSQGKAYKIPSSPNGVYFSRDGGMYDLKYRTAMGKPNNAENGIKRGYHRAEYDWLLEQIAKGEIVAPAEYLKLRRGQYNDNGQNGVTRTSAPARAR